MLRLAKAEEVDRPELISLLDGFNNPRITPMHWERLMGYPWKQPGETAGYVLMDDDRIGGFLGTIYSRRNLRGREIRFCNLSSWMVKPELKTGGAYLLKEVLADENCVISNLSAIDSVAGALRKIGFETLDDKFYLSMPSALAGNPFSARIVHDPTALETELDDSGKTIWQDHRSYPCQNLVMIAGEAKCHVVYTIKPDRWRNVAWIHYLSRPAIFAAHKAALLWYLARAHRAPRFAIESRLLWGESLTGVKELPLTNKLYRPLPGVSPWDHSNLYTEMVMLGL